MSLPEFRRDFEEVGELIYTAFQQILDVAPNYEGRADIYSTKIVQLMHDLEKTQGQKTNVLSWKRVHPEYWSCIEVYDWLQCCAEQYNIESPDCELLFERLSKLTGKDLCAISTEEFRNLSPTYGEILFMSIKLFKDKGESKRKRHRSSGELPSVQEEGNSA